MQGRNSQISFWAALTVALGAAGLTHCRPVFALVPGAVWAEMLRPLLIAVTLLALATAATLAYGGAAAGDGSSRQPAPRWERSALWTVATVTLAFLFLFVR